MRVLIADDDRVSRTALELRLAQWGYQAVAVEDGQKAWELLQEPEAPPLAILDWVMPGMDGVRIVEELRRRESDRYTYVLMLTALQEREFLVGAMQAGADDYLTKPVDMRELEVRVRAGKRIIDLQADLLAAREALREQATRDALTGIWNRAAILDALARELSRASREHHPVGVLMADVDHFKEINDTLGHPVGDQVLREVAERIESAVRCYDLAGRYGGEEFLIVLPGCPAETVAQVAQRICEAVRGRPFVVGPVRIPVSISVGATVEAVTRPDGMEDLLVRADRALYVAKDAGRDRVAFEGPPVRSVRSRTGTEMISSVG